MKTKIMLGLTAFVCASLPLSAQADPAGQTGAGNALVGPLFYTPLERDAIDRGTTPVDSTKDSAANGNPVPPAVLRFNGRVERSAGRTSAWVSGRPLERLASDLPDTRLRLQGERLRIDTTRSTRWLKAGERFKPEQAPSPNPGDGIPPE